MGAIMRLISLIVIICLSGCTTVVSSKIERGDFVKSVATGKTYDEFSDYTMQIVDPVTVRVFRYNIKSELFQQVFHKIKVDEIETKELDPKNTAQGVLLTVLVAPVMVPMALLDTKGYTDTMMSGEVTKSQLREIVPDEYIVLEDRQVMEKMHEPATGSVHFLINENIAGEIPLDENGRAVVDLTKWPKLKTSKQDLSITFTYNNCEASSVIPKSTVQKQFAATY
jgi:hypothetical protein